MFDESWDVIIVGTGFAGLSAAIEARQAGCNVLVLEKMGVPGGNSAISAGMTAAPATPLQAEANIVDSPTRLANDMLAAGKGLNDPALLKVVTERAGAAVAWMESYLGIAFNRSLLHGGGHSVPRIYNIASSLGGGATIVQALLVKCRELGITIRMRCALKDLIQDAGGRVIGVDVADQYMFPNPDSGVRKQLHADKAVILACGGFSHDVRFRMTQDPRLNGDFDTTNHPGATAEALMLALRAGATPVHLSWIQLGPWTSPDERGFGVGALFGVCIGYPHGILVDAATGKRFINELTDRFSRTQNMSMVGRVPVLIVGGEAAQQYPYLRQCMKRNVVRQFNSVEELAAGYSMNLSALQHTINAYNNSVLQGTDAEMGKPLAYGQRYSVAAPFYVMRLRPKVHYCNGGILTNTESQVLNIETQEPIPGLYAAGEMAGGINGACRVAGMATTECIVFGRIAGANAAKEKVHAEEQLQAVRS